MSWGEGNKEEEGPREHSVTHNGKVTVTYAVSRFPSGHKLRSALPPSVGDAVSQFFGVATSPSSAAPCVRVPTRVRLYKHACVRVVCVHMGIGCCMCVYCLHTSAVSHTCAFGGACLFPVHFLSDPAACSLGTVGCLREPADA